jgi:hypothetical protein
MHVDTAHIWPPAAPATAVPLQQAARAAVRRLWHGSPVLTVTGLLMLLPLAGFLAGLVLDPRTIAGAPAWLKPAKFALSTTIYALTLAWVFSWLPGAPRTRRVVGPVTAAVFVLEVGIIAVQAWRGTTSHFNVRTTLDAVLFGVMGTGILVQTVASVWVAVALWRQPFADGALAIALRAGMILTIVGASTGGLMTRPTAAQLEEARASGRIEVAGAHTVGAPDGGPGLPGTGWSRTHGDLRVPHFVGLHALQLLPLLAVVVRRRVAPTRVRPMMRLVSGSYAGVFAVLMIQALRAEPVIAPTASTLLLFGAWLLATGAGAVWLGRARPASGVVVG